MPHCVWQQNKERPESGPKPLAPCLSEGVCCGDAASGSTSNCEARLSHQTHRQLEASTEKTPRRNVTDHQEGNE